MSRVVVLDASAVIAFRDPADALHTRAVAAFAAHSAGALVLPASAYAEVLVAPMRKGATAVAALEAFLEDLVIQVEPLTADIARGAATLRAASPSIRLPDALVLATGDALDAAAVLTRDAAWPAVSARARVI